MRWLKWLTLAWPGLPQLWFAGAWSGLGMAIGFAALLNVGLMTSGLWTEWLSPGVRSAIWLGLGAAWLAAGGLSARWVAAILPTGLSPLGEDLFNQARDQYLQGHWFEAEAILSQLLDRNVLDAEARLLLAALLRRTKRYPEAGDQLDRLERMDGGQRWHFEINRQISRIQDDQADANNADDPCEIAENTAGTSPLAQAA